MKTMALYMIGDVQGCDAALQRLLDTIDFSPSRDTLYLLGDLVNRGPDSAGVLRRLMGYGDSAHCLLGNHDLHLLAVASGARKPSRNDTLDCVLEASDREGMLQWLSHQNMALLLAHKTRPMLMVHAGVLPAWTAVQTVALAQEVESMLKGDYCAQFFQAMYSNSPSAWSDTLTGMARLRVIVNALTRLRFCTAEGEMEFETKEGATGAPTGYLPWFDVQNRHTANVTVAFGHWSTLGWLGRPDAISMDTGCVWGGALSALQFNLQDDSQQLIQVKCQAAQQPGQ
jgi:bis(5'-nucleosyl)-tetraphosphatase (symmetrical)